MTSSTIRWTMRTTIRTWDGGQIPMGWTCQWHGHSLRWVASRLWAWALCSLVQKEMPSLLVFLPTTMHERCRIFLFCFFANFCILYLLLILFGGCRSTRRSSARLLRDQRRTWVESPMATSPWSTREASATIYLYVKPTYLPTPTADRCLKICPIIFMFSLILQVCVKFCFPL